MKNNSHKISANEINRFAYCPYQWYYTRYYGSRALHERYKALGLENSAYESNFLKGQRFHNSYYRSYRIKKALQLFFIILLIGVVAWWVMRCR